MRDVEIPPKLRALMAEIGPRWGATPSANVRLMAEEFTQVHRHARKDGVVVRRDISFGPHQRQSLDVYMPEQPQGALPALLFVHGGGFVDGSRNRTDEVFANVGYYFARHQIVGVNVGYRLAPEARYPEGSLDVRSGLEWVRDHAGALNVDRSRLFLMGHSTGAAHAASYAYDRRLQPKTGPGIAGLIVVGGRVRVDNLPENPNARKVEAYYGTDTSKYEDYSPVSHVGPDSVPTMVAWCEFENPLLDVYCAELVHRLAAAKRRAPPVFVAKGHNHTSMVAHLNTAEDAFGAALRDFIAHPR